MDGIPGYYVWGGEWLGAYRIGIGVAWRGGICGVGKARTNSSLDTSSIGIHTMKNLLQQCYSSGSVFRTTFLVIEQRYGLG